MILSFHPCFEADKNIICAGRPPGSDDLAAIKAADAVILPQGCSEKLYTMARKNCAHVFPNFDIRFQYPGKIGQIQLFQAKKVAHPKSETFLDLKSFTALYGTLSAPAAFDLPLVFKFDWGGEGETVYLIDNFSEFQDILQKAGQYERAGQQGFIIQEYIPSENRSLRIAVVGQKMISYWRVQKYGAFHANLAAGAEIDWDYEPELQKAATAVLKNFCNQTGINLAGFDFLFSSKTEKPEPLFLEINYFFGRRGLGGSKKFYRVLRLEIRRWLDCLGLSPHR